MTARGLVLWKSPHDDPVTARIAIAGDFLPGGALAFPVGCGWREMARGLSGVFNDAALAFVNLECALDADNLDPRPLCGLGANVSAPSASLDYLAAIRAGVVGMANNHSYDFGSVGADRTRHSLVQRGMVPVGIASSLSSAPEVFVWKGPGGVRVGFWAAARACSDLATRKSPGVEPATIKRAAHALDELKSRGARVSVALLHAGCIRSNRPDPADASLMDSIAKCGFQIVAASHSHRIGGARLIAREDARPSYSFYGLGSIVSGYISSPLEQEGLVVVAGFDSQGDLAEVEVRPVLLDENGFGLIPEEPMAQTILDRFRCLSNEIADGSSNALFYRDMSKGLVGLYMRDARAAFRSSGVRGLARKASRVRLRHFERMAHRLIPRTDEHIK